MTNNTTGGSNTAFGKDALVANTTASYNTAVGYQAGYSNTTGARNVMVGPFSGYSLTTGTENTFVGAYATGGGGAGSTITTGSRNTILGKFNGNEGGLDIRTSSNNIVLSDGDGNPRGVFDGSGNFLVGQSSTTQPGVGNTTTGFGIRNNGLFFASAYNGRTGTFSRSGTDGPILGIYKDGSSVGSIGAASGTTYITGTASGLVFNYGRVGSCDTSGAIVDNTTDLGNTNNRFDDIYATNGTIQTSDRNEKQDIEVLSDAETRVAQACKGLLRKFRWQDAVAEKGDDARIHFGIIAQDLQDAFAAEGLDAGRYAMFISSTWWETQTEVPAVEAVAEVLDDEGNVVTEAVAAKDA